MPAKRRSVPGPARPTTTLADHNEPTRHRDVLDPMPGPATPVTRVEPAPRPVAAPAGLVRLGLTIGPEELNRARAAYLSDRDRLTDPPQSFARWVVRAVERHLERKPLERMAAAKGAVVPEVPRERKVPNNIPVPLGLPERLKQAVDEERQEGRDNTVSGLVREAITVAVSDALERAGGRLPALHGPLARGR